MTRKEEIQKAAVDTCGDIATWAFRMGAEWADKTMLEKVCEWLTKNQRGFILTEKDIKDFKKAMEL